MKNAGASSTTIPVAAISKRRESVEVNRRLPKTMPLRVDPRAKPPRMTLENPVSPRSSAKATAITSLAPKMTPVIVNAAATSRSPGQRIANPAGRFSWATTGGSVALILEDTGHVPMLERPNTFNTALLEFLGQDVAPHEPTAAESPLLAEAHARGGEA